MLTFHGMPSRPAPSALKASVSAVPNTCSSASRKSRTCCKLYMLQTRNGKRTGLAAVRVALQMVDEGLIKKEEAIFRVEPNQLYDFLVPRLDEKSTKIEVLATGLPASPGAAVGQIVFTADAAVEAVQ